MGSVIVLAALAEFIISIKEIPAVYIVDIAVAVIIDAISRNFVFVGPNGILQIRVVDVDSGVNDCNHHLTMLLCTGIIKIPGREYIDIYAFSGAGFFDPVSIRTSHRCRHSQVVCQVNVRGKLRVAVLEAVCDLAVLKLRIIFQSPLVLGIAVRRRQIGYARTVDICRKCISLRIVV